MRRSVPLLVVLLSLITAFAATPSYARPATDTGIRLAIRWLLDRQQADGSFPGFGAGSSTDAVFAFAAAGMDPNGVIRNGQSPISVLGNEAASYANSSTAAAGKLTMAVIAADKNPRGFGGVDLIEIIRARYNSTTGVYGLNPTDHAYAQRRCSPATGRWWLEL
jgi:hypothetical protein